MEIAKWQSRDQARRKQFEDIVGVEVLDCICSS